VAERWPRVADARDPVVAETIVSFGYPAMSKAVVSDGMDAVAASRLNQKSGLRGPFGEIAETRREASRRLVGVGREPCRRPAAGDRLLRSC
jgi:hypothetical protein